jgi:hypothetical protein
MLFRSQLESHGQLLCTVALVLALNGCGSSAAGPVPELVTDSETQDGAVVDLAAPNDATSDPDSSRAWIAEGRVRASIRASTRQRIPEESAMFPPDADHHEALVAVEVDDAGHFLYTLTDSALYRESFAPPFSQSAPGDLVRLPLTEGLEPPLIAPEEITRDVKVIDAEWCAVMTSRRILVVASLPQSLEVRGHTTELLTAMPLRARPPDPAFDALKISGLRKMTIARDDSQQFIAYCRAESKEFTGEPSISMVNREPQVLLLCRLGTPEEGFTSPTFDTDPTDDVAFSYWDPFSAEPAYSGEGDDLSFHTLYDVEVRVLPDETRVYCACGRTKQLRELQASFGPGNGVRPLATITLDADQDLHLCKHEPSVPDAETLYVYGTSRFYELDLASPATFTYVDHEPFDFGGDGDCAFVRLGDVSGITPTVWTEGAGAVDNVCKVFDLSGSTPSVYTRYGGLWRSDGAVALDADDVYTTTWGAVVHYRRSDGDWMPAETQPNEIPPGSGVVYNTEQIDIGQIAPGDTRIFVAANTSTSSGAVEMRLDANGAPGPPAFLDPQAFLDAVGWDPVSEKVYSNEVAFLDYAGSKFVLLDMADLPRRQGALIVYRWDPAAAVWNCAAYGLAQLPPDWAGLTAVIHAAAGHGGTEFGFVGHGFGLFSVDLTPLSGAPTQGIQALRVPSNLHSSNGITQRGTNGLATSADRLFVLYNNGPTHSQSGPVPPELCVYRFDMDTGEIVTPYEVLYRPDSSSSPLHIPEFGASYRLRFHPDAGGGPGGKLYVSNTGHLFQLAYDPTVPSDPLRYTARWSSDYTSFLQDSRIYDFGSGPRILVSKDSEAFAFVDE